MPNRNSARRCLRPGCPASMEDRARQSRTCSDACRQAVYRLRKTEEDDGPPLIYRAPVITSTTANGDGWTVHFDNGQSVDVEGCRWEGPARARARWTVAQRI